MDSPEFTDGQFVNGTLLNSATSAFMANFAYIGDTLHTPGLLGTSALTITPSSLVLTIAAPSPFAVLFGSGELAGAHGTVNGADTSTYTLNLASFVPGSGSQVVYVVAQLTDIGEDQITVIGPPPGHPDYDPAFNPFLFYSVQRDSITISGTTTPPDNETTFELCRITLTVGQGTILPNQIITSYRQYASAVLDPTGISTGPYYGGMQPMTVGTDGRLLTAFSPYGTDTGSTNALAVSLSPAPSSLASLVGIPLRVKVNNTNTGSAAINVNGLGSVNIVNPDGTGINPGQLVANGIAVLMYDGTNFETLSNGGQHPGFGSGVAVYYTAGTYTFTVPAGVYQLEVEVWGAGGGAAGGIYNTSMGCGAGAGGYCKKRITGVVPGQQITVTVGAGGEGVANGSTGGTGGNSAFGSYCHATGGTGSLSFTIGDGGAGVGGDENIPGQAGFATSEVGGQWLAGAGGSAPRGGPGGGTGVTVGNPGYAPGGGGAGTGGAQTANGGNGAPGGVVVRW